MPTRLLLALFLPMVLALATPSFGTEKTPQRTISITGIGQVNAAPDIAIISLGVTSEAKTARAALDKNTKDMAALLKSLDKNGVAKKDMQTSNFSVHPVYIHHPRQQNGVTKPPQIVGYKVTNQVTAIVRKLDNLGKLLDASVSEGSNQINSIQFSIDKSAPLRDEARSLAVADATRKAKLYAQAASISLGNLLSLSESGGTRPPQPYAKQMRSMAAEAAPVPIAEGQQTVSISVHMVWEIN